LIEHEHSQIPVVRQCELVGLARSSLYYRPDRDESYNQYLMRLIDEQYTLTPFYGIRRMTAWLRGQGHMVNRKRVARLMAVMGLEAIYPKRQMNLSAPGHRIYPYLLAGLVIERVNQVWMTDITYIRMKKGFIYLVAIMDWLSRYVLSWSLSNTLDVVFCLEALHRALGSGQPEVFNSDQGVQFTSQAFTGILEARGIRISMDGRGRVFDNIFIERLWRSVKYEEVHLKDYESVKEASAGLNAYFRFYNEQRPHQALGYLTPAAVYGGGADEATWRISFRRQAEGALCPAAAAHLRRALRKAHSRRAADPGEALNPGGNPP
jgi:putative transposase